MVRSVLVTGASKGIGAAIARRLASDGFEIVVHYAKDHSGAANVLAAVEAHGGSGRLLQFDVRNNDECRSCLTDDIERNGAYYGIVSNAGIHIDNSFPAMTFEQWRDVISTDLDGFFNVVQPCVMPMVQARNGGRIVAMSSVSGILGNRGQVNYSAAKAGLIGAVKALALELAKRRITVNSVAPGVIDTGMTEDLHAERLMRLIPARRFGNAEEVSGLVSYLVSDAAAYITRQVIAIDGGLS